MSSITIININTNHIALDVATLGKNMGFFTFIYISMINGHHVIENVSIIYDSINVTC